jgi:hypothetical protein
MIEIGKEYIFEPDTNDLDYNKYFGEKVTVIRELTAKECDIEDVGRMYKVKLPNDKIIDAFEYELTE